MIIQQIGFSECKCERCGQVWISRKRNGELPKQCMKCKSPYWNKVKVKHNDSK